MVGKPRAFVHLLIVIAVLAAALALRSPILNAVITFTLLGFFLVGSIVTLWRIWSRRHDPHAHAYPSQIGWLPRKWQKWLLGEDDRA